MSNGSMGFLDDFLFSIAKYGKLGISSKNLHINI